MRAARHRSGRSVPDWRNCRRCPAVSAVRRAYAIRGCPSRSTASPAAPIRARNGRSRKSLSGLQATVMACSITIVVSAAVGVALEAFDVQVRSRSRAWSRLVRPSARACEAGQVRLSWRGWRPGGCSWSAFVASARISWNVSLCLARVSEDFGDRIDWHVYHAGNRSHGRPRTDHGENLEMLAVRQLIHTPGNIGPWRIIKHCFQFDFVS
jgi:hypothetical protein